MKVVPETYTEENYLRVLDSFKRIRDAAEKLGVMVGVESVYNHTLRSPEMMRRFLDDIDSVNFDVILDAVNLITPELAHDPAGQNALIRQAALMNFAQAPISYDNAGIAHQKLFVMQPSLQGGVLLNRSSFQSTRSSLKAGAAERLKQQTEKKPEEGTGSAEGGISAEPGTAQAATLPASARQEPDQGASGQAAPAQDAPEVKSRPQPVIPTRPQTSYKLSVPVKK